MVPFSDEGYLPETRVKTQSGVLLGARAFIPRVHVPIPEKWAN